MHNMCTCAKCTQHVRMHAVSMNVIRTFMVITHDSNLHSIGKNYNKNYIFNIKEVHGTRSANSNSLPQIKK
jgi:hypothetical protein